MNIATPNPLFSNNSLTHDLVKKVTNPEDLLLLCPIKSKQVATTNPHYTIDNECLHLQMKKYQIEI
jgi:hypothetical protein